MGLLIVLNCKHCGSIRKNVNSLRNHERLCKCNVNRQHTKFTDLDWQFNKIGTNQYDKARRLNQPIPVLSLETKQKISKKQKLQKPKTPEVLQRLSILAKERKLGGVTQSRWIRYNGKTLGSVYELAVAKDLDANNILWDTCKRFKYIDPFGKERTYTPDLYLPEYNVYLDPKNDFLINSINPSLGFNDLEKIKLASKFNNIEVLVLNKHELTWNIILGKIQTMAGNPNG